MATTASPIGEITIPQIITGIHSLIVGFNNAHAGWGYYGKEKGWKTGRQVKLEPDKKFPAYKDVSEMVSVTVAELIATASVRTQGFGGVWHLINHAAGITELERRCGSSKTKRSRRRKMPFCI